MPERSVAVQMYVDGNPLASIVAATGMSKSTVYWYLAQAGIQPNRTRAASIAGLHEKIDRLATALDALRTELAAVSNAQAVLAAMVVKRVDELDSTRSSVALKAVEGMLRRSSG